LRITIIGYGKLGKSIEDQAVKRGHEIVQKFTSSNLDQLTPESLASSDVIVECSTPSSAYDNLLICAKAQIPTVSGTTGWLDKYDEVSAAFAKTSFLYASNFSIGMNIVFEVNKLMSRLTSQHSYIADIQEIHHTEKLDAPSGTAITLAEGVINNSNYHKWQLTSDGDINNDSILPVEALREDKVPGTHYINYVSDQDEISLKHLAHNRSGFGLGAVLAMEYIKDKTGIYSMKDVIGL
jgi:4-hydroxy-tetrahydrodipicolinate reductase